MEIGPNCSFDDEVRKYYYEELANKHALIGGESNRCLQNFLLSSTQYNEKVFKAFKATDIVVDTDIQTST